MSMTPFMCLPPASSAPAASTVSAWHSTQVALVEPAASCGWPERGNAGVDDEGSPWHVPHAACPWPVAVQAGAFAALPPRNAPWQ